MMFYNLFLLYVMYVDLFTLQLSYVHHLRTYMLENQKHTYLNVSPISEYIIKTKSVTCFGIGQRNLSQSFYAGIIINASIFSQYT